MDIKKIKYAYFDLDGTLLTSTDTISETNLKALNKLKKHGVKVGIITGRHSQIAKKQVEDVQPNLPLVSINGALVISPDYQQVIYESQLDKLVLPFIHKFAELNFDVTLDTLTGIAKFAHLPSPYFQRLALRCKNVPSHQQWGMFEINDLKELEKIGIYKVCLCFENEKQKEMILQIKPMLPNDIEFLQSSHNLIDLLSSDVNKGSALKHIDGKYINLEETLVFGDNENDVSMFRCARYSVAMKNAHENVRKHATTSTKYTNFENGVAKFINEYWPD